MVKNSTRRLGRPPGDHDLRKLRSAIWYQAVKSVDNLNDCQLDILFGTGKDEEPRNSADRIKMFEAIRVNRSIPSNGKNGRRNFDLVARVDAHPEYKGTAAIIRSPLWRLLEKKPLSLKDLRETVLQCIINLDSPYEVEYLDVEGSDFLQAVEFNEFELFFEEYFEYQNEAVNSYHIAMGRTFKKLEPSLDYIGLLAALSYEAIEGGNMAVAANLFKSLRIILKEYCEHERLGHLGKEFYQLVISRIRAVLNKDNLHDFPSYISMLSTLSNANSTVLNSPVARFLEMHERMVWPKYQ